MANNKIRFAQMSSMSPGTLLVLDTRGFERFRVSMSSNSSGATMAVNRVYTSSATAAPSSAVGHVTTLTGETIGDSTSGTVDWPWLHVSLTTGSLASTSFSGYVALS